MTTRKKKPFWTKLLSALLVASMLVGTAGTSSFAAGDPQQKTETAAAVILIRHLHRDLQPLRRDLYRSYRDLFPQWDLRRSFRQ